MLVVIEMLDYVFLENDNVTKTIAVAGVYFAENLNRVLRKNWKSFSTQNYFDPQGVFLSTLWSGPLLVIAMIILVMCSLFPFLLCINI